MKRNEIRALIDKYKENEKEIKIQFQDKMHDTDQRVSRRKLLKLNESIISDLERLL